MKASLFFHVFLHVTSLITTTTALCTNLTAITYKYNTVKLYDTEFAKVVDTLYCPESNSSGCSFPRRTYNLTIKRFLNISTTVASAEDIFDIAGAAWEIHTQKLNLGSNPPARDPRFINRDTIINTTKRGTVDSPGTPNELLAVAPGQNTSLVFVPFMKYVTGKLDGCANSSLDDVGVRVVAPYVTLDVDTSIEVVDGILLRGYANATGGANVPVTTSGSSSYVGSTSTTATPTSASSNTATSAAPSSTKTPNAAMRDGVEDISRLVLCFVTVGLFTL